jgi:hypothetical protein
MPASTSRSVEFDAIGVALLRMRDPPFANRSAACRA